MQVGQLQINGPGLAEDSLLDVKLGELFDRAGLFRGQFCNFFVNCNGLGNEAIREIKLCEAFKVFQSLESFTLADVQVAEGHQRSLILRLLLEDLHVFLNG